ncbi:MAG: gamma-glutamyl-gamma-aminobutyrate hydrolase family protein [Thermodesulfobacteriota bacterium]
MLFKRIAPVMSFCLVIGLVPGALFAENAGSAPAPAPDSLKTEILKAGPIWIVVNMFTGPTSKQAKRVRDRMEELGPGGRGIVLPYREITVENMRKLKPAFLVLSPNGVPWCRYRGKNGEELQEFFKALKTIAEDLAVPVVGICGGHQALALAFGGKVAAIRGDEDDCLPYGKNPTERGRQEVQVLTDDPIFRGMGKTLNMVQNHFDEVKRLPDGFVWLAGNSTSPYQIIRHPSRPVYGIQAHSEYFFGAKPDGGLLLRNFIEIAQAHNRIVRGSPPAEPIRDVRSARKRSRS